ncbi:hypothetical protein H7J86_21250 [Mycobacterium hackensackense]|nr:hypothetical protein [Mycobacterium hackensackense]MCV7254691.1 hypothetical protein [Mycobacterium hackensackense]
MVSYDQLAAQPVRQACQPCRSAEEPDHATSSVGAQHGRPGPGAGAPP